jgi:uncharacterized protein YlzI (FlbEa/FlbD family)
MDTREDINNALAEMGEPPLGAGEDVVGGDQVAPANGEKHIELLEPPGQPRCQLVFMNGRSVIVDQSYEDVMAEIRDFHAHPEQDFLRLDVIDVVEAKPFPIVVRDPTSFSRRAMETMQSAGRFWTKFLPGGRMDLAGGPVGELQANAELAKTLQIVGGNRAQRRHGR